MPIHMPNRICVLISKRTFQKLSKNFRAWYSFVHAFSNLRAQLVSHIYRKRLLRYFNDLKKRLSRHKCLRKCMKILLRRKKRSSFISWKLCARYQSSKLRILKTALRKLKLNVLLNKNVRISIVRLVFHSIRHKAALEIQKRYRIHSFRRRFISMKKVKRFFMKKFGIKLIKMRKNAEKSRSKNENMFVSSVLHRLNKNSTQTDYIQVSIYLAKEILKEASDKSYLRETSLHYQYLDIGDDEKFELARSSISSLLRIYFCKRLPPQYFCSRCLKIFYFKNLRHLHKITCSRNFYIDCYTLSNLYVGPESSQSFERTKNLLTDNFYISFNITQTR